MRDEPRRLWIGRRGSAAGPWLEVCAAAGIPTELLPLIEHEALPPSADVLADLEQGRAWDWLFLTSARGARRWVEVAGERAWTLARRIAAVGPATAEAAHHAGATPDLVGSGGGAELAADFLALGVPRDARLLFVGAEAARPELAAALHSAGYVLTRWAAYRTMALPGPAPAEGEPVLLFSPSGVDALRARVADPSRHPALAVGRTTAAAVEAQGFPLAGTLDAPHPEGLAALLR
jgi:uroporphyrinogen-III synthase